MSQQSGMDANCLFLVVIFYLLHHLSSIIVPQTFQFFFRIIYAITFAGFMLLKFSSRWSIYICLELCTET
jgi:hypothetical protein